MGTAVNLLSSTSILTIILICAIFSVHFIINNQTKKSAQNRIGLDIPEQITNFSCFIQNGYNWVIPRAYHSYGAVDTNAPPTLKAAIAAGMTTDVYFFPCTGKNARSQVDEMINYLSDQFNGTDPYSIIWVDFEENPSPNCSWDIITVEERCTYLQDVVDQIQVRGRKAGIYSSPYEWKTIFSNTTFCSNFTSLPLWYPDYNQQLNFNGFKSFGGWTQPYAKQYSYSTQICGHYFDSDYSPNAPLL